MCHIEHILLEPSPLKQLIFFLNLKNTLISVVLQLCMELVKSKPVKPVKSGQKMGKTSQNRLIPYGTVGNQSFFGLRHRFDLVRP